MRFLKPFLLFESQSDISIYDVAWLYFLRWVYDGKLSINTWSNDDRMGVSCDYSLSKFGFVYKLNGNYIITELKQADRVINKYFGAKNFEDAIRKKLDVRSTKFNIETIPYDLFLYKNPSIETAFDRISDRIVEHFNSQGCYQMILEKLSRSRRIKEWNLMKFIKMFPDEPNEITLYRGLKYEYDPKRNESGFSCWTTDMKQAERFAKYRFTGGMQFSPMYSDDPHILTANVPIEQVVVFIGGDESEVILRNPVNIESVEKLKKV